MLLDYAATELGCLDHYSDSASNGKTIRGLGAASLYIGLRDELFKSLNVSTPNEEWFPLDFIKETIQEIHADEALKLSARKEEVGKHYLKLLNAGANKNINLSHELDKYLITRNHLQLFVKMFNRWANNDGSSTSQRDHI
eukprot:scaffold42147_cov59-Attheya_sp.AAC.1